MKVNLKMITNLDKLNKVLQTLTWMQAHEKRDDLSDDIAAIEDLIKELKTKTPTAYIFRDKDGPELFWIKHEWPGIWTPLYK